MNQTFNNNSKRRCILHAATQCSMQLNCLEGCIISFVIPMGLVRGNSGFPCKIYVRDLNENPSLIDVSNNNVYCEKFSFENKYLHVHENLHD